MQVIGLDIGGANLKVSDGERTISRPFALWKNPELLSEALAEMVQAFPDAKAIAVTMTGELADCFPARSEGVRYILDAVDAVGGSRHVVVWQTGGEFVSVEEARELTVLVGAANWHALATWAGRMEPQGTVLLLDVGSTTTDIIPIDRGVPVPEGTTDLQRLISGELVYLGVRRTPLCAVADSVTLAGASVPLAREFFASTLDVGLLTGHIPENPDDCDTANGRPATKENSRIRLSRMLCSDQEELTDEEIDGLAQECLERMTGIVGAGLKQVLGRQERMPSGVLLSGEGEFLGKSAWQFAVPQGEGSITSLNEILGKDHSRGACAFALDRLARERL